MDVKDIETTRRLAGMYGDWAEAYRNSGVFIKVDIDGGVYAEELLAFLLTNTYLMDMALEIAREIEKQGRGK